MLSKFKNKLKTNEAEHWQKIKNSQSQFKIYWLLKLKIKVEAKVETRDLSRSWSQKNFAIFVSDDLVSITALMTAASLTQIKI